MAKYRIIVKDSFIIVKSRLTKKDEVSQREIEYLEKNYTVGLFRVFFDGKKTITYTAPKSVSLEKYMSGRILDSASFWKIIAQVVEAAKTVELGGLYPNKLWMDMHMVFINEKTQELYFIYQPLTNVTSASNVYAFISDIAFKESKKYVRAECEYLTAFQQFLRDGNNYRLENIYAYIEKVAPDICRTTRGMGKGKSEFLTTDIIHYQKHYEGKKEKESDDTVCLGDEGTVLLDSADDEEDMDATTVLVQGKTLALLHERGGVRIEITKDMFSLGKSRTSDYCISDNTAVSRRHAVIVREGNDFYLADEGSTNGTLLNGTRLKEQERALLADGDEVILADERFTIEIN